MRVCGGRAASGGARWVVYVLCGARLTRARLSCLQALHGVVLCCECRVAVNGVRLQALAHSRAGAAASGQHQQLWGLQGNKPWRTRLADALEAHTRAAHAGVRTRPAHVQLTQHRAPG